MANFEGEIQRALEARASGNEGKARVCARRAAGIAAGEYLARHHIPSDASAIERFETIQNLPGISPRIKEIIGHLLLRVDQDHQLDPSIDLIADACELIRAFD